MRKKIIVISGCTGVLIVILFIVIFYAVRIPVRIVTQGRIVTIKGLIERYQKNYGQLPKTLDVFRDFNKNCDITKDEWGNQLIYTVDSNNFITLKSNGRDNKPGGKGRNSDIILRFRTGDQVDMPFDSKQVQ